VRLCLSCGPTVTERVNEPEHEGVSNTDATADAAASGRHDPEGFFRQ